MNVNAHNFTSVKCDGFFANEQTRIESSMGNLAPIATIQEATARHFGVPIRVLTNREASPTACHARWVAMFVASTVLGKGPCEIGRRFKRDHSTVCHGLRKVAGDPVLLNEARAVTQRLSA